MDQSPSFAVEEIDEALVAAAAGAAPATAEVIEFQI
jgi:hypothetical protein